VADHGSDGEMNIETLVTIIVTSKRAWRLSFVVLAVEP
jgi:hypothetical protein